MYCVKPNDMPNVLRNTASHLTDQHLIMSIVAGVQLDKIEQVRSYLLTILDMPGLVGGLLFYYTRGPN